MPQQSLPAASQNTIGSRQSAPPFVSFNSVPAGTTTAKFVLPAGVMEIQCNKFDTNSPGVTSLEDGSGNVLASVNTVRGALPGQYGTIYYVVPPGGGTYEINVTVDMQSIVVFFDQYDL